MSALELIDRLADRGLVTSKLAASLRKQIQEASKPITAENLAKVLVKKGQLTAAQAKMLLATPTPPKPPAPTRKDDDELGLAEDTDQLLKPIDEEDDIVEPVEPVALPPRRAKRSGPPPAPERPAFDDTVEPIDTELDDAELDSDAFDDAGVETGGRAVARRRGGLAGLMAALRPKGPKKFRANQWDSPLILLGGGTLLVLIPIAVALYMYLMRGTGDEDFAAADERYRGEAYGQATDMFQQFISNYPDHPKVGIARVRIGMAKIWNEVERHNWPGALDSARANLPAIEGEEAFNEARDELATLLPDIMEGFADAALASDDVPGAESNLALANEAMTEVNNSSYLPTSTRKGQQPRIDQILGKLETVKRRINQDRELESTVAKIQAAAEQGNIAAAYDFRKSLLTAYPALEPHPRLAAAIVKVSDIERTAVQPWASPPQPVNDDNPVASQFRVVLAQPIGKQLDSLTGRVAFVQAVGAVYGLDAADGKLLWRRYLGYTSTRDPIDLSPAGAADVLVVDGKRNELIRLEGKTGKLLWRLPCPGPLTQPSLSSGRILVACQLDGHGVSFTVDPQDGRITGGVELPVPVSVSPTYDADRQRYIQPAAHSSVYVFSAHDWTCAGVTYLGHAADTVRVSPAIVGDMVLIAENPGNDFSLVHVLGENAETPGMLQKRMDPKRLNGQIVVPLQVLGKRVLAATNRGQVQAFELDVNQAAAPLRDLADAMVNVSPGTVSYPLLDEGRIWVGDNQLTGYELQASRGQMVRKWIASKGDQFVGPLFSLRDALISVRRKQGKSGVTVAATAAGNNAIGVREGEAIWEIDLGVAAAGDPFVNRATSEIHVVTANGALYAVTKNDIRTGIDSTVEQAVFDTELAPLVAGMDLSPSRRAFAPAGGGDRIVVEAVGPKSTLQVVRLELGGQTAACEPAAFHGGLLLPLGSGSVSLFDGSNGQVSVAPYIPPTSAGADVRWFTPSITEDGMAALVADARGSLYHLVLEDKPQPHLQALQHGQSDASFVAAPLVVGDFVAAPVRGAQNDVIRRFGWDTLQIADQFDLPGRIVWGPIRADRVALVMTDQGRLVGFDAQNIRFDVAAPHGITVGRPAIVGSNVLLASQAGVLWLVSLSDGQTMGQVDVGETLGTGPVPFADDRYLVCSGDGTLHVVPFVRE